MRILCLLAILCAVDTSSRKSEWKPYSWDRYRVGSWAMYEVTRSPDHVVEVKATVEKMTRDKVHLAYAMSGSTTMMKVEDRRPEEPDYEEIGARVIGRGFETIPVGKEKLVCRWLEYELGGTTIKSWISPKVPIGLVRLTVKVGGEHQSSTTWNLTGYER